MKYFNASNGFKNPNRPRVQISAEALVRKEHGVWKKNLPKESESAIKNLLRLLQHQGQDCVALVTYAGREKPPSTMIMNILREFGIHKVGWLMRGESTNADALRLYEKVLEESIDDDEVIGFLRNFYTLRMFRANAVLLPILEPVSEVFSRSATDIDPGDIQELSRQLNILEGRDQELIQPNNVIKTDQVNRKRFLLKLMENSASSLPNSASSSLPQVLRSKVEQLRAVESGFVWGECGSVGFKACRGREEREKLLKEAVILQKMVGIGVVSYLGFLALSDISAIGMEKCSVYKKGQVMNLTDGGVITGGDMGILLIIDIANSINDAAKKGVCLRDLKVENMGLIGGLIRDVWVRFDAGEGMDVYSEYGITMDISKIMLDEREGKEEAITKGYESNYRLAPFTCAKDRYSALMSITCIEAVSLFECAAVVTLGHHVFGVWSTLLDRGDLVEYLSGFFDVYDSSAEQESMIDAVTAFQPRRVAAAMNPPLRARVFGEADLATSGGEDLADLSNIALGVYALARWKRIIIEEKASPIMLGRLKGLGLFQLLGNGGLGGGDDHKLPDIPDLKSDFWKLMAVLVRNAYFPRPDRPSTTEETVSDLMSVIQDTNLKNLATARGFESRRSPSQQELQIPNSKKNGKKVTRSGLPTPRVVDYLKQIPLKNYGEQNNGQQQENNGQQQQENAQQHDGNELHLGNYIASAAPSQNTPNDDSLLRSSGSLGNGGYGNNRYGEGGSYGNGGFDFEEEYEEIEDLSRYSAGNPLLICDSALGCSVDEYGRPLGGYGLQVDMGSMGGGGGGSSQHQNLLQQRSQDTAGGAGGSSSASSSSSSNFSHGTISTPSSSSSRGVHVLEPVGCYKNSPSSRVKPGIQKVGQKNTKLGQFRGSAIQFSAENLSAEKFSDTDAGAFPTDAWSLFWPLPKDVSMLYVPGYVDGTRFVKIKRSLFEEGTESGKIRVALPLTSSSTSSTASTARGRIDQFLGHRMGTDSTMKLKVKLNNDGEEKKEEAEKNSQAKIEEPEPKRRRSRLGGFRGYEDSHPDPPTEDAPVDIRADITNLSRIPLGNILTSYEKIIAVFDEPPPPCIRDLRKNYSRCLAVKNYGRSKITKSPARKSPARSPAASGTVMSLTEMSGDTAVKSLAKELIDNFAGVCLRLNKLKTRQADTNNTARSTLHGVGILLGMEGKGSGQRLGVKEIREYLFKLVTEVTSEK